MGDGVEGGHQQLPGLSEDLLSAQLGLNLLLRFACHKGSTQDDAPAPAAHGAGTGGQPEHAWWHGPSLPHLTPGFRGCLFCRGMEKLATHHF